MSKSTRNAGKQWTATEKQKLKDLSQRSTSVRVIGLTLGRTAAAVVHQASKQRTSLRRRIKVPTAPGRGNVGP